MKNTGPLVAFMVAVSVLGTPAVPSAANKEHQQIMAELRMLQEQQAQLQQMIHGLAETLKVVTIRLDEVRLVEGRDTKRNGFLIGAVSGAVVGGGLLGFVAASGGGSACNGDCGTLNAVVGGAVAGAAVGGLFGLMVDGLIKGRQTLFGGSTTIVTPVISPDKKAIDVAIRWR